MSGLIYLILFYLSIFIVHNMIIWCEDSIDSFNKHIHVYKKIFIWFLIFRIGALVRIFFSNEISSSHCCVLSNFIPFFLKGGDWICNSRKSLYEPSVVPKKTSKWSYFINILWSGSIHYGFNLFWIHNYPFLGNDMPQILNLLFIKITLP